VKEGWIEAPLPFERRGEGAGTEGVDTGDRWYWACSFNQAEPVTEYVTYWHRRFDDVLERYIDFQGRRGKVAEQSGKYKAYRMPLNILILPWLEWYAVGDLKAVRELCSGIVAIGKKCSQGHGIVERWEVEEWPEDWSEVRDGRLTRAVFDLPPGVEVEYAGKCQRRIYGVRPPYWDRANQSEVWMP